LYAEIPPLLVLYGTVFPKIARFFGKGDRRFILEEVQNILAARIEEPEANRAEALPIR